MTLAAIGEAACAHALAVMGALHPDSDVDFVRGNRPADIGTLVLLGPDGAAFWPHFTASPEYRDGASGALDRWSARVIGDLAARFRGRALFPFGGPPHHPFLRWALQSGRAHRSPVGMLVHDRAGLMVSYRGALGLPERLALTPGGPSPCAACADQPCRNACPVGALHGNRYDVAACKADLDRPGNDCMAQGCAARRACPVSRNHGRPAAQSAFHMRAFR